MNFDLLGFLPLFFSLIIIAIFQGAAALGAMYVLHQDRPLGDILTKWAAIALPGAIGFAFMTWIFGDTGSQIVAIFLLAAMSFPIIVALYRLKPHVKESTYGTFDFHSFQRGPFQELVVRLALVFIPLTVVLHVLEYLFVARLINKYTIQIAAVLFVVEVSGIAAGLALILQIEKERVILLTVVSALVYIVVIWYLIARKMLY